MICTNAEVDRILRLPTVTIFSIEVFNVFGSLMSLPNSNDSSLGSQDGRDKVSSSDVADTRHAEGSIFKISLDQATRCGFSSEVFHFLIDGQNTLVLDLLNGRYGQTIRGVDGNRKVMVMFDNISLNVTILVQVIVNVSVHKRVLVHRQRNSFNEERKHGKTRMMGLQLLA